MGIDERAGEADLLHGTLSSCVCIRSIFTVICWILSREGEDKGGVLSREETRGGETERQRADGEMERRRGDTGERKDRERGKID